MAKRPLLAEGGNWGFVVVFASFFAQLLITAMTRCTGVLFSSFQNEFMSTTAQTGAISSIISSTSYFGCTFGGVLGNRFGCRFTAELGGLLNIVGMIGGALTTNIYQMYTMGALAGVGNGIAWTPTVVIVSHYFKKNFAWATGFMYTGIGVGLLVFAPFMQLLLDMYGWRGTLLITGAITANICAAGAVYRPTSRRAVDNKNKHGNEADKHEERIQMIDEDGTESDTCSRSERSVDSVRKNALSPRCFVAGLVKLLRLNLLCQSYRFSMFCFAQTNYIMSYSCFLVYLIPCATTVGVPDQRASFLIGTVGIGSIVGYLLCGVINKKVSSHVLYEAAMFTSGCAILVSQFGVHWGSYTVFLASAATLGFAVGFQNTIGPVIMREFVGEENLGSAVGIYAGIGSVVDLVGPILAGALYDATDSFSVLFYVFAAFFFVGFLAMLSAPFLKRIEPGLPMATDGEHM